MVGLLKDGKSSPSLARGGDELPGVEADAAGGGDREGVLRAAGGTDGEVRGRAEGWGCGGGHDVVVVG